MATFTKGTRFDSTGAHAPTSSTKTTTTKVSSSPSSPSYNAAPTTAAPSSVPAYNAKTGQTTGATSKEYDAYLKSLNKKGSANYVPTEDDTPTIKKTPMGVTPTAQEQMTTQTGASMGQTATPGAPTTPQVAGAPAAGSVPAAAPTPVQTKYQTAAANLPGGAAGMAPIDGGQAMAAVNKALPRTQDTSAIDAAVQQDPVMGQLLQGITQLLNPEQQSTSLMQDYDRLYKKSGLGKINKELIDAETVINGTEDDIRNEIQTAGGFATDSQVQAMGLARNKSLLKRYNQLVQMQTNAQNQLNTMTSLNAQDKQMAQTKVNTQIGAMFNLANFRQQAINNTREQARWTIQNMGADGVYNAYKNDPQALGRLESVLGMAPGGMQVMAARAAQDRLVQQEGQNLDLSMKRLQLQKLQSEVNPSRLNILSQARSQENVQSVDMLARSAAIDSVVGPTLLSRGAGTAGGLAGRFLAGATGGALLGGGTGALLGGVGAIPGALVGGVLGGTAAAIQGVGDTLTGERSNFIGGVEQLRSQLNLDTLIDAKNKGATFGALSDQELKVLSSAGTKLGTWAVKDSNGDVIGYRTSEANFRQELDKINYFAKLDYVLKGGNPAEVGVIENKDGTMWVQNSDGTLSPLQ